MIRRPLFVANWKMNKTMAETKEFLNTFNAYDLPASSDVAICAPFIDLPVLAYIRQTKAPSPAKSRQKC